MRILALLLVCFTTVLSAQNQRDKAIDNFNSKNYDKAEIQLKAIIKENPNDLIAYEYLGDVYAAQKKWDNAIEIFENLFNQNPDNANYSYKYGGSLGLKAKSSDKFTALFLLSDVKKYLQRAADLDENHIDVRWALLELYLELPGVVGGSVTKAKDYASQLERISPVDGALAFGKIADYEENFKSAETNYLKALKIGGSSICYTKLIELYQKYGKYDKALNYTSQAVDSLNQNNFNFTYAEIAIKSNLNTKTAITYIDKYIQNYNKDSKSLDEAFILKSKLHHQLGQIDEAKFCLQKALAYNPSSAQAKSELQRIEQL